MYLNFKGCARPFSIPFISEGSKTGSLFLSISGCCDDFRRSQTASSPIQSHSSLTRIALRLLGKVKISNQSEAPVHGQIRNDFGFKQVSLLSIKPGHLWQITAANSGFKWQFPIQLTELEARLLLPYLQTLDCWEFDERGVPIQVRRIHAVIELMVTGTLAAFCFESCQGVQFFHHPGIRYGFWKPRHQSLERYAIAEQLILPKSEWIDVQLTDSETQQQIRGPSPPTDN